MKKLIEELRQNLLQGPNIHVHKYALYSLADCPEQCPWYPYRDMAPVETIDHIFAPIAKKLPKTVAILNARCEALIALLDNGQWYLFYVLVDGKYERRYLCGGAPQNKPILSEFLQSLTWSVPPVLTALYAIHNGFGIWGPFDLFWNYYCVRPDDHLHALSESFPEDEKHTLAYNTDDLLEFFPDGAGNAQCFYRQDGVSVAELTVDWDHETRELSREAMFWQFVDNQFRDLFR